MVSSKQLARLVVFGLIIVLMNSCRAASCGCPMSQNENGQEWLNQPLLPVDTIAPLDRLV